MMGTVPCAPVPDDLGFPTLRLTAAQYDTVIAHCYDGFPDEACGLLAGPLADGEPTGEVTVVYPCENAAHSARVYRVGGRDLMRATLDADARDEEIIAVWHSHTHTDAYPSPTDIRQAVDPMWVYVIVSLRDEAPVLRAFRIRDGEVAECQVVLEQAA
jgi:proteasome lid subunit RPN8/RPN11